VLPHTKRCMCHAQHGDSTLLIASGACSSPTLLTCGLHSRVTWGKKVYVPCSRDVFGRQHSVRTSCTHARLMWCAEYTVVCAQNDG
jgi:hypothetical protein